MAVKGFFAVSMENFAGPFRLLFFPIVLRRNPRKRKKFRRGLDSVRVRRYNAFIPTR